MYVSCTGGSVPRAETLLLAFLFFLFVSLSGLCPSFLPTNMLLFLLLATQYVRKKKPWTGDSTAACVALAWPVRRHADIDELLLTYGHRVP
jgi:hypothetical protein